MNVYAPKGAIDETLIINKSGIENIGYGCGESLLIIKNFNFLLLAINTLLKKFLIFLIMNPKRKNIHRLLLYVMIIQNQYQLYVM